MKENLKKFMHWPKKIDTREMLTKETPPNAFLMVRFKCFFFFSMKNIVTVIQFVLKVFFSFSLSTVGTDH